MTRCLDASQKGIEPGGVAAIAWWPTTPAARPRAKLCDCRFDRRQRKQTDVHTHQRPRGDRLEGKSLGPADVNLVATATTTEVLPLFTR